jgi:UDP-GlcNAc:undecaprenyl-phosphate GlcNAc-1-phosphate transferase
MAKLGHTGAVVTLYVVTALFGLTSYLYIVNEPLGLALLVILIIVFEIFIEYTGLISPHYRPILGLFDLITGKKNKAESKSKEAEETKTDEESSEKPKD